MKDSTHSTRLSELNAIAKQIKALESMVAGNESADSSVETEQEDEIQRLDAEEETVTREFLEMLELEDDKDPSFAMLDLSTLTKPAEEGTDRDPKVLNFSRTSARVSAPWCKREMEAKCFRSSLPWERRSWARSWPPWTS